MLQPSLFMVLHDPPNLLVIRLHEPADARAGHVDALHGRLHQRSLWAGGEVLIEGTHRASYGQHGPDSHRPLTPKVGWSRAGGECRAGLNQH